MLKKLFSKLVLVFMAMFFVISCQNIGSDNVNDSTDNCEVITHSFGKTKICNQVQNVAVLGGYPLAQLLSLGYQPYGFADFFGAGTGKYIEDLETSLPNLGSYITTKPLNLGIASNPSLETLSESQPDLIIGETRNQNQYEILSQIAPTLLFEGRTLNEKWQEHLLTLAQALNEEEKADRVIQEYEENLAQTKADFSSLTSENNRVLLLAGNNLNEALFTLGEDTDLHHIFTELGFEVISLPQEKAVGANIPISLEVLPELGEKADYIFVLGYNTEIKDKTHQEILNSQISVIKEQWQTNPLTKSLSVTENDRVYFASYALWNSFNGAIASNQIITELREFLLNN